MGCLIAAIYTRQSVDRGDLDASVETQERICREWATLKGWVVGDVYTDRGKSAYRKGVIRPGYLTLLEEITAGRVDRVVALHLDRLTRRPDDFQLLIEICHDANVPIFIVRGELEASAQGNLPTSTTQVSNAWIEGQQKAVRLMDRNRDKAQLGLPPRNRLFGRSQDCTEVVEEEAALIREAASRVLNRETPSEIAADWGPRGILQRNGNPYTSFSVRHMLTTPSICGDRMYRGEVAAVGCWEPIISPLEGAQVRNILSTARGGITRVKNRGVLIGLLFCGLCGERLTSSVRSFACNGCKHIFISKALAEQWTMVLVTDRLRARNPARGRCVWNRREADAAIAALDTEDKLLHAINKAFWVDAQMTRAEWTRLRDTIALTQSQAIARLRVRRPPALDPRIHWDTLAEHWENIPPAVRRQLIEIEISSIVVHPSQSVATEDEPDRLQPVWARDAPPNMPSPSRDQFAPRRVRIWSPRRHRVTDAVPPAEVLRARGGPMTMAETCRISGLSYEIINRAAQRGRLVRMDGHGSERGPRFELAAIDDWLACRAARSDPERLAQKQRDRTQRQREAVQRRRLAAEGGAPPISDLVYSRAELAAALGITTSRVDKLAVDSQIPFVQIADRRVFPRQLVAEWINDPTRPDFRPIIYPPRRGKGSVTQLVST